MDHVLLSYSLLAGLEVTAVLAPALVPFSMHMILAASLIVFIGASLSSVQEVADKIEQSDAMQFPFFAGAALAALFVAFRYLPNHLVNALLNAYFCCVGVVCVGGMLLPLIRRGVRSRSILVDIEIPWVGALRLTAADIIAYVLGAAAAVWYGLTKGDLLRNAPGAWVANNILGAAFAVQGIERLALGEFKTGAMLLSGLFLYDIVMVFGTPLMVRYEVRGSPCALVVVHRMSCCMLGVAWLWLRIPQPPHSRCHPSRLLPVAQVDVATKLDGPIKLLFPRGAAIDPETGRQLCSLLGLGDIVIPGIFLALLLRYDALRAVRAGTYLIAHPVHRGHVPAGQADASVSAAGSESSFIVDPFDTITAQFPRPFFNAALIAYAAALAGTVVVMVVFDAAQPALLYIVPAILLSSVVTATLRGEWGALLAYRDEHYVSAVIGTSAGGSKSGEVDDATPAQSTGGVAVSGEGDNGGIDAGSTSGGADDAKSESGVRRRVRRRD